MSVALTGGTGFVGQAVLEEAARQGITVRALTRRPQAARPGVEWVEGDLADTGALARLVDGTRACLHIAGVVNAPDAEGFVEGNVRGTERLVAAATGAGLARFVLVSSLAAREPGLSNYGKSKRDGELVVEASGLDWTIVRPPAVYGPRDTELFELFRAARWGLVPVPASGRSSFIHVTDLARLLIALLPGGAEVSGKVFEPDDGREGGWSHDELARALGTAVGGRARPLTVPTALFGLAARIDRTLRGRNAKLTPDRARYMVHPDWTSSPDLGVPPGLWTPNVRLAEGLRETAAWYRADGRL